MSTRTTGKRKRLYLAGRMAARDSRLSNDAYTTLGHIRAEYDGLARRIRKMKRAPLPGRIRCLDESDFIVGYNMALNDVLALLREAKR